MGPDQCGPQGDAPVPGRPGKTEEALQEPLVGQRHAAHVKVQRNNGAPSIDGVTFEAAEAVMSGLSSEEIGDGGGRLPGLVNWSDCFRNRGVTVASDSAFFSGDTMPDKSAPPKTDNL